VPFPGATGCFFTSLNASGQAVGYAINSDDLLRGFLYDHDTGVVVLPEIAGLYASQALAINDLGHVVLIVSRAIDEFTAETRTYLWSPGASLVEIGAPAGAVGTIGLAINNLDHVVGGARLSDASVVAFRWTAADGLQVLTFDAAENQVALIVDDNGRVLGRTVHNEGLESVARLFLWTEEAGVINLNVPGAHSTFSSPLLGRGMNNSGDILANFWTSYFGDTQAVVWRVRTRPPTPQETIDAIAEDVASLPDAGSVSEGEVNALQTKLDAALTRIAKGKPKEAANALDAFVNQVEAMVRSGKLTAGEGQQLIDAAQALIAELRG
jgi:hypothetical protein